MIIRIHITEANAPRLTPDQYRNPQKLTPEQYADKSIRYHTDILNKYKAELAKIEQEGETSSGQKEKLLASIQEEMRVIKAYENGEDPYKHMIKPTSKYKPLTIEQEIERYKNNIKQTQDWIKELNPNNPLEMAEIQRLQLNIKADQAGIQYMLNKEKGVK